MLAVLVLLGPSLRQVHGWLGQSEDFVAFYYLFFFFCPEGKFYSEGSFKRDLKVGVLLFFVRRVLFPKYQ